MYPIETKLPGLWGIQGAPFSQVLCVAAKVRGKNAVAKCHPKFVQLIEHENSPIWEGESKPLLFEDW